MTTAIIVSAGKGRRMGGEIRKQYLLLDKRPILAHTLEIFGSNHSVDRIVLVLPPEDIAFCRQKILKDVQSHKPLRLIGGGKTRQASVYNGLQAVGVEEKIVLIHDGVRPFVRSEHISSSIEAAAKYKACTLAIPADDTLKRVDHCNRIVATLPRKNVWFTQTPQTFHFDLILSAHEQALREGYVGPDDAVLVERLGKKVRIICGSKTNIKITTKEDLALAQAIIASKMVG